MLQRLPNKGARKRREGVLGRLFKLLVKEKLLYSGNVPVNAELRPLSAGGEGNEECMKVQRYGTLNEADEDVTE